MPGVEIKTGKSIGYTRTAVENGNSFVAGNTRQYGCDAIGGDPGAAVVYDVVCTA